MWATQLNMVNQKILWYTFPNVGLDKTGEKYKNSVIDFFSNVTDENIENYGGIFLGQHLLECFHFKIH